MDRADVDRPAGEQDDHLLTDGDGIAELRGMQAFLQRQDELIVLGKPARVNREPQILDPGHLHPTPRINALGVENRRHVDSLSRWGRLKL
jgi:hypothetical protein